MMRFAAALFIATIGLFILVTIALADCTGCAPGKGYEHLGVGGTLTTDSVARFDPPKTVLTIRPDGTIARNGKPLEYVERDELIVIIGELIEVIQKR